MALDCNIKISITLSMSKILAYLIFVAGICLDIHYDVKGQIWMWSVPFSVGLVAGKQGFDMLKEKFRNKV